MGVASLQAGATAAAALTAASAMLNASAASFAPLTQTASASALQVLAAANAAGGSGSGSGQGGAGLLQALAAAALAGSPPGAAASMSSSSIPLGTSRLKPNCAPSVALTVVRVPIGSVAAGAAGNWSISIGSPLPFCNATAPLPEVGMGPPHRAMTLPPSLIAAQPPPTLTLSLATLAWLTGPGGPVAAPGATSVDFHLVQWGAAPMSETAGVGGLAYAPAADSSAAVDSAGGAALRRRQLLAAPPSGGGRALSLFSSLSAFFSPSTWAAMVSSAFNAARAGLNAVAPPPSARVDRLPSHPMDSRVFTVEVSSGGGPPVAMSSLSGGPLGGLFYITVPLRDLSIVSWTAGGGAAGVDVGQGYISRSPVFNVTCPASAAAGVVGAFVSAVDVSLSPPMPAPLSVRVAHVSSVVAAAPAVTEVVDASGVGDAVGSMAGGGGGGAGAAPISVGGDTLVASTLFVLQADCGAPYGNASFACGPGMGGEVVTFACPRASPTPTCLHYDKPTGAWTTAGCTVAAVQVTSILCACDHLADFGTRYATLDNAPPRVFVTAAPGLGFAVLPPAAALLALVAGVLACMCGAAACGQGGRGAADRAARFTAALRGDSEVAALQGLGGGTGWAELDVAPAAKGGARVVPLGEGGAAAVGQKQAPLSGDAGMGPFAPLLAALAAVDAAQAPPLLQPGMLLPPLAAQLRARVAAGRASKAPPPPRPPPPHPPFSSASPFAASAAASTAPPCPGCCHPPGPRPFLTSTMPRRGAACGGGCLWATRCCFPSQSLRGCMQSSSPRLHCRRMGGL